MLIVSYSLPNDYVITFIPYKWFPVKYVLIYFSYKCINRSQEVK